MKFVVKRVAATCVVALAGALAAIGMFIGYVGATGCFISCSSEGDPAGWLLVIGCAAAFLAVVLVMSRLIDRRFWVVRGIGSLAVALGGALVTGDAWFVAVAAGLAIFWAPYSSEPNDLATAVPTPSARPRNTAE